MTRSFTLLALAACATPPQPGSTSQPAGVLAETDADEVVYYLLLARGVPDKVPPPELLVEHGAHLAKLDQQGKLALAGPFLDRFGGAIVLRAANLDEARRLAEDDPMVRGGFETYELVPWKRYLVALMALAVNATLGYENYFAMIPTGPRPTEALTEGFFELATGAFVFYAHDAWDKNWGGPPDAYATTSQPELRLPWLHRERRAVIEYRLAASDQSASTSVVHGSGSIAPAAWARVTSTSTRGASGDRTSSYSISRPSASIHCRSSRQITSGWRSVTPLRTSRSASIACVRASRGSDAAAVVVARASAGTWASTGNCSSSAFA